MRLASLFAVVAALILPALPAHAGEPCGFEYKRVEPVPGPHVYVEMETRECPEGRSLLIGVGEGSLGRLTLEWYDDERGRGFETFHPPYFLSWTDTERGCVMVVFVLGEGEVPFECVAGAPPPPPTLP